MFMFSEKNGQFIKMPGNPVRTASKTEEKEWWKVIVCNATAKAHQGV